MPLSLISADAVVPMTGATVLHKAGVVLNPDDGTIAAVGPLGELQRAYGDLHAEHFAGVMLPGFVNAHVHLELGYQRRQTDGPVKFTEWVGAIMKQYPAAGELEALVTKAVQAGVRESLAAGVTCVGDISRHCEITRRALAQSPLRVVSFGEVVGLEMRARVGPMLDAAANTRFASPTLTIGVSPHAPYTVEGPTLTRIAKRAAVENLPVAMHLAELSEERAFLEDLSGPLGRSWDVMLKVDVIDAAIPLAAGGPLRWAERWGLLGDDGISGRVPVVLAHVNYVDKGDLALLEESNASVAYCPRTRAFFGHDAISPHPYKAMLRAGINVCLGTDSLASNPDLSVLREAALLHLRDSLPAQTAMEMITSSGAMALGINAGRLQPGTLADIIVMPTISDPADSLEQVLHAILTATPSAAAVWIGGRRAR